MPAVPVFYPHHFVEDEGYKISYYIGVDANNKVLVAYGEFDYDTVEMFDANGKSLGTLACQLPDTGYMNVMSHFATAELSNLVISEGCEGPKSGPKG